MHLQQLRFETSLFFFPLSRLLFPFLPLSPTFFLRSFQNFLFSVATGLQRFDVLLIPPFFSKLSL